MKKLISFALIILTLILFMTPASALTVGEDKYNIFCGSYNSAYPEEYYIYLSKLMKSRGRDYSSEELVEVYNQISFYLTNRASITSDDKLFLNLLDSIVFVGIRDDNDYSFVEVIIRDMGTAKAEMFREYICDSDAVILWDISYPAAPSYDDIGVRARTPFSLKLKSGQSAPVPIPNKSKVRQWKSSNTSVMSVKNGAVTALKAGDAVISAVFASSLEIRLSYKVTDSPYLYSGSKKISSITVKKGKTKSVKIYGKAKSVNNKYTKTKKAKITSKKTSSTVTVRGLKKGTTTLKITVNNSVVLKLKVKVKK